MVTGAMVSVYDKMRHANNREERLYQQKVHVMMRDHADTLAALNRTKVALVEEVRAHKCRQMRKQVSDVIRKETLTKSPKKQCAEVSSPTKTIVNPRFVAGNQGFSRIMINVPRAESEMGPGDARSGRERCKVTTAQRAHTSPGRLRSYSTRPRQRPVTPGTDPIIIYYPGKVRKHGKQDVAEASDEADGVRDVVPAEELPVLGPRGSPLRCMQPANAQAKRPLRPYPSYVHKLRDIDQHEHDQYTDGTMAYEMRLSRRKQKERLPTLSGHLQVRAREPGVVDPMENLTRIRESVLGGDAVADGGKVAAAFLQRGHAMAVLDPRKVHPFVAPHRPQDEADSQRRDVQRENARLQRLRTVGQRLVYERCVQRTAQFLGWRPSSSSLLQRDQLSHEEQLMLSLLQSTERTSALVQT